MSSGQKQDLRVHVRWMIRRDMPEVLAIEGQSFEFPWAEDDFLRQLRQRNCIGMVADHGDEVVGFMIYELHKTRLHVLNFAVAPEHRRRGIGRQMMAKLMGKLSSSGAAGCCWKCARRISMRNCSFAPWDLRGLGAARLLRGHAGRRLCHAIPLPHERGSGRAALQPGNAPCGLKTLVRRVRVRLVETAPHRAMPVTSNVARSTIANECG